MPLDSKTETTPPNPLQRFITAMEAKDAVGTKNLLTPELLAQVTDSGQTLVHIVAKCLDQDLFSEVCTYVAKNKPEILNKPDIAGNTPLHVVCQNNKLAAVKCLLTNLGNKADDAAKTVNNVGTLPIQLVDKNPLQTEADQIRKELVTHMERHHLPPMSHQVNVDQVLAEYHEERKKIPAFEHAVRKLVQAMNELPPTLSSTHPLSELIADETDSFHKPVVEDKISEIRNKTFGDARTFYSEFQRETESLGDLTEDHLAEIAVLDNHRLKLMIETAVQDYTKPLDVGNCAEQAIKLIAAIHKLDPNLYAQRYYIKNGDHCLVAIKIENPENPDAPFLIFGDYYKKVVCIGSDFLIKLGFYQLYKDEVHKIYLDVYGPLNPNYHVMLPELAYGNPYCFFSNIGILIRINLQAKKRFFLAKDNADQTEMHEVARFGDCLRLKIYLKFLDEFKDHDLKRTVFFAENKAGRAPLDSAAYANFEQSTQLLFDEYLKIFADLTEFFNFLLRKKYQFFRIACEANNSTGIDVALLFFAKFRNLILEALKSLLIEFIQDDSPDSISKLKFLSDYSNELWKDETKSALKMKFLATKPDHPKHKVLWEMCKLKVYLEQDTQNELLAVHPAYLELFALHAELSKIKVAEAKAAAKPSFFQKKRTFCLKKLPATLTFDADLKPNIDMKTMLRMKEFLQPTETLVDSFTAVTGMALAVAQCT